MKNISAETLQIIQESAELCQDAAAATMGTELQLDEKSILEIDALVAAAWKVGSVDESRSQLWGAFLGEVMCRALGARWVETEAGLGVAVGTHVAHPMTRSGSASSSAQMNRLRCSTKHSRRRSGKPGDGRGGRTERL